MRVIHHQSRPETLLEFDDLRAGKAQELLFRQDAIFGIWPGGRDLGVFVGIVLGHGRFPYMSRYSNKKARATQARAKKMVHPEGLEPTRF